MAVFRYVKFQVCLKSVNISFEPEFGNPRFETPKKLNVFNFQFACFSAIVDFIIWFCTSLSSAEKPGVLNLFLSHFFFMLSSKRGVSNPAFQNSGSNPTWFWKPEKNPFQTWKRPFLVYFKGSNNVWAVEKDNKLFIGLKLRKALF